MKHKLLANLLAFGWSAGSQVAVCRAIYGTLSTRYVQPNLPAPGIYTICPACGHFNRRLSRMVDVMLTL